jgi:hypothetical protein
MFAAAFAALAAFNVNLSVSNKQRHAQTGMNLIPMNDEKLIIKYTYDDAGNMIERKVVLVEISQYSMTRKNAKADVPETDGISETGKKEDIFPETDVRVYPNPNQGMFWLNITGIDVPRAARIEIFTVGGAQVISRKITSLPHAVDISDRPAGIYFLRITFGNDYENVWKIIKN